MGSPYLSVIVVSWNTAALLAQCLRSVEATACNLSCEVVVVDNGSSDGSQAMLREQFPTVRLVQNSANLGFARASNQGFALSRGRYGLLLNSDAILLPDAVPAMLKVAEADPRTGIVGARLLNGDGSFQASYTPFPSLLREFLILSGLGRLLFGRWYPSRGPEEEAGPQVVDYVEGACMLVRREAFEAVGGLDEQYFMYAEEVDLCYAMRQKGWRVYYQPSAKVIHLGGGSSRKRPVERECHLYQSRVRFCRKHYGSRAAELLKLQIIALTATKVVVRGLARRLCGKRYARPIVPLKLLITELGKV